MNRIYILGEVLSVSKMHFDYYNKLKGYFKFSILDMYGNVFECVVLEKRIKKNENLEDIFLGLNEKKEKEEMAFVICSLENGKFNVCDMY